MSAFLVHQEQASQITPPKTVTDHDQYLEQKPSQVAEVVRPDKVKITEEITTRSTIEMVNQLLEKNSNAEREILGEVVIKVIEGLKERQPADTMLINTLLYLNNQDDWQSVVEAYWGKN